MKSYLHGMLTGGLIVFSFMFLMGNKKKSKKTISKTTRAKFIEIEDRLGMLEGSVNDRFKMVGENFIYLKDKFSISVNTDFDYKSRSLIQNPFPYKMNKMSTGTDEYSVVLFLRSASDLLIKYSFDGLIVRQRHLRAKPWICL